MLCGVMLTGIIPYQELLGNYDMQTFIPVLLPIIPYQELLGNYDRMGCIRLKHEIIPYQELLGNYDQCQGFLQSFFNYTIPRAIREL